MFQILLAITTIIGSFVGVIVISLLGLLSIFNPELSDELFQRVIKWANSEED